MTPNAAFKRAAMLILICIAMIALLHKTETFGEMNSLAICALIAIVAVIIVQVIRLILALKLNK